jgi:hypothetical protein
MPFSTMTVRHKIIQNIDAQNNDISVFTLRIMTHMNIDTENNDFQHYDIQHIDTLHNVD